MNKRIFVKPVGHIGHFVLATGEICQDGSLRELPGEYQSPRFRSYNEACELLFGTIDLRVIASNIQQQRLSLMERLSVLEKLMVLNRALREHTLPEATPRHFMGAKMMCNYSDDEADKALAILG